jgi:hypothetical protein
LPRACNSRVKWRPMNPAAPVMATVALECPRARTAEARVADS